jgi:hypothetical protein
MSSSRVAYAPRSDATPEAEISALSNVYAFVISCATKDAAGVTSTGGDDEMKGSRNDSLAITDYTRS